MPSAFTYDAYQLGLAPPSLRGPNGEAYVTAFGLIKDGVAEAAIDAVKCRWYTSAPEDALLLIGTERGMPQIAGVETIAKYRTRVGQAWNLWQYAGTRQGVATAIGFLGYVGATIKENADWQFPPSPGQAAGAEWWRFWVIIRPPHPFGVYWTWGASTTWGSARNWGVGGTQAQIAALRNQIQAWKAAHTTYQIVVIFSGLIWGNTIQWGRNGYQWGNAGLLWCKGNNWGDGATWGGSSVTI